MSLALIETTFLSNPFRPTKPSLPAAGKHVTICCSQPHQTHQHNSTRNSNELAKLALVAVAAGVLTLGSVDPAAAAKTAGRVGGQAFRSAAPRPSAPRARPNNSRTNIYINPPVAPAPPLGGYGYGGYYGGWGWSPFSYFAPAPTLAVGGFDTFLLFILLGAATALARRFFRSRQYDDDDY